MPRPKAEQPTPAELEILKILWLRGPSTGREVHAVSEPARAYTSVMSLLNIMCDKGLVTRMAHGRPFVYQAKSGRDSMLGNLVEDLLRRAFEGSASTLVASLLDQARPTPEELKAIRESINSYLSKQRGTP